MQIPLVYEHIFYKYFVCRSFGNATKALLLMDIFILVLNSSKQNQTLKFYRFILFKYWKEAWIMNMDIVTFLGCIFCLLWSLQHRPRWMLQSSLLPHSSPAWIYGLNSLVDLVDCAILRVLCIHYIALQDKAYIATKKVSYDVIQKGKKWSKELHKVLNILFVLKKGKTYLNNFTKLFWLLFYFWMTS